MKLLLLISCLALSACSTVSAPETKMLTRLGVSYAVVKVIGNNPAYGPRIQAIAHDVRAVAGGEKFDTVALLMEYTRGLIRWDRLTANDTLLVSVLLDEVKAELVRKVGSGKLSGDGLLAVAEVAGWIEDAAAARK